MPAHSDGRALRLVRIPATHASRVTIWGVAAYGIVLGLGILASGPERWVGPDCTLTRDVPGGPATWGWAALAAGLLVLAGSALRRFRLKAWGLFVLSAWAASFGWASFVAAVTDSTAGVTSSPTYALVALVAAVLVAIDETAPAIGGTHGP